jgi:hypothetical protein
MHLSRRRSRPSSVVGCGGGAALATSDAFLFSYSAHTPLVFYARTDIHLTGRKFCFPRSLDWTTSFSTRLSYAGERVR